VNRLQLDEEQKMGKEQRVVIVGGVACGPKTACRLKRLDPSIQVTVLEKGQDISYGACGMPAATPKGGARRSKGWQAIRVTTKEAPNRNPPNGSVGANPKDRFR
jgi:hypothetical protein